MSIPVIDGAATGSWKSLINTTIGLINTALTALATSITTAVAPTGQTRVIPTSVAGTGTTLGAAGRVIATAATSISVNGCFTSAYDNYRIVIDVSCSGAATVAFVLRAAGVDATAGYDTQRLSSNNATTTSAQGLNAASVPLVLSALIARNVGTVNLFSPALAAATLGNASMLETPNPMTTSAFFLQMGIQHRTLSAYDGFTVTPSTGTLTGTIRIYGFNNN